MTTRPSSPFPRRPLFDAGKRLFDLVVAAVGLVLSAPVLLVVAVLVRVRLGSPVLFRQQRVGRDGRVFELVKFRTMLLPDPAKGRVSNESRMTPLGRALRSWSLDELPSLWNILRGDMSLVGPRPLLVDYLDRYTPEQFRRHEVRPGLTGLAQVSGRNLVSFERRFDLDLEYVRTRGVLVDLRILLATARTVLRREGISSAGHAVGEPFTGRQGGARG